ncbi:MAG: hypothetical protein AAGJ35_06645, partial [Myxococcota bacterium]
LYRVSLPFLGLLGCALLLITYIPALSLWLPTRLGTYAAQTHSGKSKQPSQPKLDIWKMLEQEKQKQQKQHTPSLKQMPSQSRDTRSYLPTSRPQSKRKTHRKSNEHNNDDDDDDEEP